MLISQQNKAHSRVFSEIEGRQDVLRNCAYGRADTDLTRLEKQIEANSTDLSRQHSQVIVPDVLDGREGISQAKQLNVPFSRVPQLTTKELTSAEEAECELKVSNDSLPSTMNIVPPPPLKSAFKSSKLHKKASRGVRGLWNESHSNPFTNVDNDLFLSIRSFLSLPDQCRLSMVSRRFNHVSSIDKAWETVDATEMVHKLYEFHLFTSGEKTAASETSASLTSRLNKHAIRSLTIRNIDHRLQANRFLPRTQTLQELTLTGFRDLTDTHVHVMLLGVADVQARTKTVNRLRKLELKSCSLLSDPVVRSIALHCPYLEELSLFGCDKISDIRPLATRFKHRLGIRMNLSAPTASLPLSSLFAFPRAPKEPGVCLTPPLSQVVRSEPLASLFSLPATNASSLASEMVPESVLRSTSFDAPPASNTLETCLVPPKTSQLAVATPPRLAAQSTAGNIGSLICLFAPPGTSPNTRRASPSLQRLPTRSNLSILDLSYTSVPAANLLKALVGDDEIGARVVELKKLLMLGTGEVWQDHHLQQLCKVVDMTHVKTLEIDYPSSTSYVTEGGLQNFLKGTQRSLRSGFVDHAASCFTRAVS